MAPWTAPHCAPGHRRLLLGCTATAHLAPVSAAVERAYLTEHTQHACALRALDSQTWYLTSNWGRHDNAAAQVRRRPRSAAVLKYPKLSTARRVAVHRACESDSQRYFHWSHTLRHLTPPPNPWHAQSVLYGLERSATDDGAERMRPLRRHLFISLARFSILLDPACGDPLDSLLSALTASDPEPRPKSP